ncbi:MAG: HDIG domain-containing protein [Candidatus Moduliflexus flocculans]|nr:HDIG domain-containing protein [Candidatus Moduliflexus flocculans]
MQFFLRSAPGTYQHSLQVANLAEQAAELIGADALQTRVGALFHDIGKAMNPSFFIENQPAENIDPHDDIPPEESAAAIIAHVTDGVSLARKHRLPRRMRRLHPRASRHHGHALPAQPGGASRGRRRLQSGHREVPLPRSAPAVARNCAAHACRRHRSPHPRPAPAGRRVHPQTRALHHRGRAETGSTGRHEADAQGPRHHHRRVRHRPQRHAPSAHRLPQGDSRGRGRGDRSA